MDINEIPKFVINLERRPDRLKHIKKEMSYMGWDFELFNAIDLNNHKGCTLSHVEIINIAKSKNYESVLVIEDDCSFMPYAKSFLNKIGKINFEFGIINLAPTLNAPISVSSEFPLFLDISKKITKNEEIGNKVYATNMIIYHKSVYDDMFNIREEPNIRMMAIDVFVDKVINTKYKSYSPILPIATQISDWSDVSQGMYNNFYTQTYNWNVHSPIKIPNEYLDFTTNQRKKEIGVHENIKI